MHGYFMDIRLYHKVSFPFRCTTCLHIPDIHASKLLHAWSHFLCFLISPLLHNYVYYILYPPPFLFPSTSVTESMLYHTHTHTHTDSISQAKAVSQPFAYREYRKEKIRQKIEEQRASRVKEKVTGK